MSQVGLRMVEIPNLLEFYEDYAHMFRCKFTPSIGNSTPSSSKFTPLSRQLNLQRPTDTSWVPDPARYSARSLISLLIQTTPTA
eukprot:6543747-Pyramimonas_sp.AAC.1